MCGEGIGVNLANVDALLRRTHKYVFCVENGKEVDKMYCIYVCGKYVKDDCWSNRQKKEKRYDDRELDGLAGAMM